MREKRNRMIRLPAFLLLFCLMAAQLPVTAYAAADSVPIYIGDPSVDYMAEEILKEIPTAGKSDAEKIGAVYDWIIQHCSRTDWDGTYYFDDDAVYSVSESDAYQQTLNDMASRGELVYRYDGEDLSAQDSGNKYDSNDAVAYFASDMMFTRCGTCVHFSALFTVLVGHLGYDSRMVSGYFLNSNGTTASHTWNYVLINGQYYWFDIRMDHATYHSGSSVPRNYFMVSNTETWAKKHSWSRTASDYYAANAATIVQYYQAQLPANETPFTDISVSQYYYEAVKWAVENSVVNGTSASTFSPNDTCSRAQIVTMLWRAAGSPQPEGTETAFTDVSSDAYYAQAVQWAVDNGITNGTDVSTFSPDAACSRAQIMTMLWRAAGNPQPQSTEAAFTDVPSDAYYAQAVRWAVENGITNGTSASTFSPNDACSRAQAVTFLYRGREIFA